MAAGHPPSSIHYVGARRGIETRLLPPTGFPHTFLDVTGLQRRMNPRTLVANAVMPLKMVRSVWAAYRLLGRLRPSVAVSVGGYASVPAMFAARMRRVPIVVVSYDKRPGWASRLVARFARVSATGFDGMPLPRAVHTGSPLRQSILAIDRVRDRADARGVLGLPADRFVVAVFGGSQGAGLLNRVTAEFVERHGDRRDLAVRHIVGERFVGQAAPEHDGASGILYQVVGYEEQMPQVYAAADLMVVRGGASTVAELSAIGAPAIIVPWALAADDHQTVNAAILADHGGAISIPEASFTVDVLAEHVTRLVSDPAELSVIGRRAWEQGEAHRSGRLIDLIDAVGGGTFEAAS